MESLKIKKLKLKKEAIATLSSNEQANLKGGWTTSFQECTEGWVMLCCAGSNLNCTVGSCKCYQ